MMGAFWHWSKDIKQRMLLEILDLTGEVLIESWSERLICNRCSQHINKVVQLLFSWTKFNLWWKSEALIFNQIFEFFKLHFSNSSLDFIFSFIRSNLLNFIFADNSCLIRINLELQCFWNRPCTQRTKLNLLFLKLVTSNRYDRMSHAN